MPSLAEQRALREAAEELETQPPQHILRWAVERYAPSVVLASGFGLQSVTQVQMLHELGLLSRVEVFYLETDLLFEETHQTRRKLEEKYGFQCTAVRPTLTVAGQDAEMGPELWDRNPSACCRVRKVEPLRRFLRGQAAWITGLRRSSSRTRAAVPVIMWDETHQLVKVNPMACMDEASLVGYINAHGIPYNAMRDRGYRSVGCTHCTRPVADGEDERAGRWSGKSKTECGIHVDGQAVPLENSPATPAATKHQPGPAGSGGSGTPARSHSQG